MLQTYQLVYSVVEGESIWEFEHFDHYKRFRQYGLTAQKWEGDGLLEESGVYDICVSYDDIMELKALIQRNQVTPVALYDAVSDWLVGKY